MGWVGKGWGEVSWVGVGLRVLKSVIITGRGGFVRGFVSERVFVRSIILTR